MALEYVDFEVKIERRQENEYAVSVIKSPAGEASGTFMLPFTPKRLKTIQETIEIALVRSMMPVRRIVPPEFERVKEFGRQLFAALFKNDVKSCYDRSSAIASGEGKGLRLKLRLDPTLANLPWEFMYSRGLRDYLALCRTAPPVRYTELPQPVAPLEVTPPLRILVVSLPTGSQWPRAAGGRPPRTEGDIGRQSGDRFEQNVGKPPRRKEKDPWSHIAS